jgi:hypothetical protein
LLYLYLDIFISHHSSSLNSFHSNYDSFQRGSTTFLFVIAYYCYCSVCQIEYYSFISFFIPSRSRFIRLDNMFLFFHLLLSGDIEPSHDPASCTFNVSTLNTMSLINRVHYTALFALLSRLLLKLIIFTCLLSLKPGSLLSLFQPNYWILFLLDFLFLVFIVQLVRIIKTKLLVEVLLFVFKFSPVLLLFLNHLKYPLSLLNFQNLVRIQCLLSSSLIYQGCSFSQFLNDFQTLVSLAATTSHEFLQSINQYSFNWQLTNCNCRQTNAQSKLYDVVTEKSEV